MSPPYSPIAAAAAAAFSLLLLSTAIFGKKQNVNTFIILVDPNSKPYPLASHLGWYSSLLSSTASDTGDSGGGVGSRILHVYETVLHGFSATLSPSLSRQIKNSTGILAVLPDYLLHPHTTRSPAFLGLDRPSSRLSIPSRWRGECQEGDRFNRSHCNRKLIGARYFAAGYSAEFGGALEFLSPRDSDGHGTHVASIAAGSQVAGAGFYGFAGGVARGMAPGARIAGYKVCWASGCLVSDVVSAIDKAVSDGVDVISLSLGSSSPAPFYYLDPLAIATFRASLKGVFIATSAGNGGPLRGTVANSPPWITTVGAGTIDRDFPAVIQLGNGKQLRGISISVTPRGPRTRSPLLAAGKMGSLECLPPTNGSIVFWEADRHVSRVATGLALKRAGATGMVVFHGDVDPDGLLAEPHVIPTAAVGAPEARLIKGYIKMDEHPTAAIFSLGTDLVPRVAAPVVASFSARGPNAAVPWVLKPDLLAPGVNILGAWTGAIGPAGIGGDVRRTGFNVMSGTSMACPHVSGVAALIRAARPEWGPWDVKSALMTTAVSAPVWDESGRTKPRKSGPLEMGSGYISPNRAVDPGLVYDLGYEDYAGFLCGLNYRENEIRAVSGRGTRCGRFGGKGVLGFNYPGFVVREEDVAGKGKVVFERRLKRVDNGGNGSWYKADVAAPEGYSVEVEPRRLWFGGKVGEKLGFTLVLSRIAAICSEKRRNSTDDRSGTRNRENRKNCRTGEMGKKRNRENRKKADWWAGGMLTWREEAGEHVVGSPIVVFSLGSST